MKETIEVITNKFLEPGDNKPDVDEKTIIYTHNYYYIQITIAETVEVLIFPNQANEENGLVLNAKRKKENFLLSINDFGSRLETKFRTHLQWYNLQFELKKFISAYKLIKSKIKKY